MKRRGSAANNRVAAALLFASILLGLLVPAMSGATATSGSSDQSMVTAAQGQADAEIADQRNSATVAPGFDGGVVVQVSDQIAGSGGASPDWVHATAPDVVIAPGRSGIGAFDFGDDGVFSFSLLNMASDTTSSRTGNDVVVSDVRPGVDEIVTASDQRVETFFTATGEAATKAQSFTYHLDVSGSLTVSPDDYGNLVSIMSRDGIPLVRITAPWVVDSTGNRFHASMSYDESAKNLTLSFDPTFSGAVGSWTLDPLFSQGSTGTFYKTWCPGSTYAQSACSSGGTYTDMAAEWGADGSTGWASRFSSSVTTGEGLFVGAKSGTSIANLDYARNRYTIPSGLGVSYVNFMGYLANPSGRFACRAESGTGGANNETITDFSAWRTTTGNINPAYAPSPAPTWIGVVLQNRSGASFTPTSAGNKCIENGSSQYITLTLTDSGVPATPSAPSIVSPKTWYRSGDTATIVFDNVLDAQSGAWRLYGLINGTSQGFWGVCNAYQSGAVNGGDKRPCMNDPVTGSEVATFTTANSQPGQNTFSWKTMDYAQNLSASSGAVQYNFDGAPPSTPAVTNLTTNTRADRTAVLSWPAATDATPGSGLDHYQLKIWPNGQSEPADADVLYGYHSTGSTEPYANVRLGVAPAQSTWKWCWRVEAVDTAGNISSPSSVGANNCGTSTAAYINTSNQMAGTSGDASASAAGGGITIGQATGNVAIESSDIAVQGYGADLDVSQVYNSQDIDATYRIGQTSGTIDQQSLYSQGSLGLHVTAPWERRLVRADDGSTFGQTGASGAVMGLDYIDESGTHWPFTRATASSATWIAPLGLEATLSTPISTDACYGVGAYQLAYPGASKLCFDADGRLLRDVQSTGHAVTYIRDATNSYRVSTIQTDDPAGTGTQMKIQLLWGQSAAIGGVTYGYAGNGTTKTDHVYAIQDLLGRQVRFAYTNTGSGEPYIAQIARFADSSSATALTRQDFAWSASPGNCGGCSVITGVDTWIYADDPATATSNDALKHHFDIAYSANNQATSVTEQGTASRSVGTSSESIPATSDLITSIDYVPLVSGGTAGATANVNVATASAATKFQPSHTYTVGDLVQPTTPNGHAFRVTAATGATAAEPAWPTTSGATASSGGVTFTEGAERTIALDWLGRALTTTEPLESGATLRASSTVVYDGDGKVSETTDAQGNAETITSDAIGNALVDKVNPADHKADMKATTSDYASSSAPTSPTAQVVGNVAAFQRNAKYVVGDCVDSHTYGTFQVTSITADGKAGDEPVWPSSGTVTSNRVTFTHQTCGGVAQSTSFNYNAHGDEIAQQGPDNTYTCTYYTGAGNDWQELHGPATLVDVTFQQTTACPTRNPSSGAIDTSAHIKGSLTDNTYNESGWLIEAVTDSSDTLYTPNIVGEVTQTEVITNASDHTKDTVTKTKFDGAGRAVRTITYAADGAARATSTARTMDGQAAIVTTPSSANPTGLATPSDLDSAAAGDATTTYFDARAHEYEKVQPDARIVTIAADAYGNSTWQSVPHATTNASPAGTTITYFLSGNKATKTDPAGITTTYDNVSTVNPPGAEHPKRIDSPITGTTNFAYDDDGNATSLQQSASNLFKTINHTFDGAGNETTTEYKFGMTQGGQATTGTVARQYDNDNNLTQYSYTPTGGSADVTTNWYGPNSTSHAPKDTLYKQTRTGGVQTDNVFSTSNGLLSVQTLTLASPSWTQETDHAYDSAGRESSATINPASDNTTTTYAYEDKSGRLSTSQRPDGIDETFAYDEHGRVSSLKSIKHADSTWQGGDTYSYDSQNRITSRNRKENGATYQTSYAYDPAGQVVSESNPFGIVRTYTYGDGNSNAFGTDLQAQRLYVDSSASLTGSITLERYTDINACATTATCSPARGDGSAVVASLTKFSEPGAVIDPTTASGADLDVAHVLRQSDAASWFGGIAPPLGACVAASGHTFVATANTGDKKTGASAPSWNLGAGATTTDNNVTWTEGSAGCDHRLALRTYAYDTNSPSRHQLVQMTGLFGATEFFAYDNFGRQIYRGASAFVPGTTSPNQTWDVQDRPLTLVDDGAHTVTMTWQQDKPLLASYTVSGSGLTHYLYYDASDRLVYTNVTGTGGWNAAYAYDAQGLQAMKTGGNWYYLDRSTRGDITAIRNASGALQATARYAAYGELAWQNEAGVTAALTDALAHDYNGRDGVVDLGGGLEWMRARVYSATQGRFVSADAVPSAVGSSQSAYNYANGNPISQFDPTGKYCITGPFPGHASDKGGPGFRGTQEVIISFKAICSSSRYRYFAVVVETVSWGIWNRVGEFCQRQGARVYYRCHRRKPISILQGSPTCTYRARIVWTTAPSGRHFHSDWTETQWKDATSEVC